MKILYICNEYPPKQSGGIGMFTKLMAEKLADNGHEVIVFGYGRNKVETSDIENKVKVIRLVEPKFGNKTVINIARTLWARYAYYKYLKKHLKDVRPEIIESYDWSGPLLFKIKGVKLIVRLHGSNTANNDYMNKKRSVLYSFIEKRAIKIADKVVSVSNHVAEQTKKSFKMNFSYTTIYNGVDLSKFKDLSVKRDLNKLLVVGRMHDYKGFKELFDALNAVFKANDFVYIDIICTVVEDYKENLMKRVERKYHQRIHFIGRIDNDFLATKYNEANLLILPSLTEAFPIIPLESMACGTPVIMSNRFSSKEIIKDKEDGFLVNVLDSNALAAGILDAISDQNKIDAMRCKAINKIATTFGIEKIRKENITFYKSIQNK